MKAFASLLFAVFLPLSAAAQAPAAEVALPDAAAISGRLLDHLDAGEYDAAEAMFNPTMRAAVPADKLRAVWTSLPPASDRGQAKVTPVPQAQVVRTTLSRGPTQWTATVAVAVDGSVAGLLVQPYQATEPVPPPPADASYDERDFTVGEGERALPGTLAMPRGAPARGLPVVVLVHGSGPHDRNETMAANRPFLDLGRGLAARGIATLRYDKRSSARPQAFAHGDYTMDEETTDDAVAAVAALRRTPGIDPARIYVLGHSQGGMLAPRIAQRAGKGAVAGLVLMAAPARSLLDLIPEQNRYLALLDGSIAPDEQAGLDAIDAEIARVRDGHPAKPGEVALGVPLGYWRAFDRIDPVADARALAIPMLLVQGGRDIQVVDTDWQRWQAAFAHDPRATLKHYPALNHLGIAGSGPGGLGEYGVPGHVDATLVADIAAWIQAH